MIITEGTTIDDPVATMGQNIPQIHGEKPLLGWENTGRQVHAAGGKIMPQLWHVGFDEVDIHGAHGYLVGQFFGEGMNERTDEWGGRSRFAVGIIKAIRTATHPDYPILLRYSQWKQQDYAARLVDTPQLLEEFLASLADAGVDMFHCSTRRYWEPEFEGEYLNLAGWIKKITGKPTRTVGSVGLNGNFFGAFVGQDAEKRSVDDLIERLEKGEFDLVAVGWALLQDPQWANKIRQYTGDALATLS